MNNNNTYNITNYFSPSAGQAAITEDTRPPNLFPEGERKNPGYVPYHGRTRSYHISHATRDGQLKAGCNHCTSNDKDIVQFAPKPSEQRVAQSVVGPSVLAVKVVLRPTKTLLHTRHHAERGDEQSVMPGRMPAVPQYPPTRLAYARAAWTLSVKEPRFSRQKRAVKLLPVWYTPA